MGAGIQDVFGPSEHSPQFQFSETFNTKLRTGWRDVVKPPKKLSQVRNVKLIFLIFMTCFNPKVLPLVYFVHQFQLFLSNVYLRKPTVTILHLSSA